MLYISWFFILISCTCLPLNDAKPIVNNAIKLPLVRKSTPHIRKRAATSSKYALYNQDHVEYLTKVNIGTPPQEFLVTVDTGSADLWVPSSLCPKDECPYSKFQDNTSSTYESMDLAFSIQYGAGSIEGSYVKETVSLVANTNQQVKSQPIGLANSAKDGIISLATEANGILGLAFPALTANSDTDQAYEPFVFNLASQKLISEPVFSISLDQEQMMIGGIDKEQHTGDVHYVPVVKNTNPKTGNSDYTFWSVDLQDVRVNNESSSIVTKQSKKPVILDTGTTLSYVDKALADEIVKRVTNKTSVSIDQSSDLYTVDCDLKSSNTKVELAFSSGSDQPVLLEMNMQDLILPLFGSDNPKCAFGITYNFDKSNTFVFGGTVLRSAYFVYDMGQKRVGLATAINSKSQIKI
ncbi:gastricsin-like [Mucor ambiguus]|uniref:rhizopuspepsin n=1 Tax=Mucor ambiguus TaxID=91626 RepID=A0A0C9M0C3_9FUNG|nr:gastricsin-like [Mucor ambiguus]